MVHDPRAPRLAAFATLTSAVLVLITALNLVLNVVGETGFTLEEGATLAAVPILLFIGSLANKQRPIPELVSSAADRDQERFDRSSSPYASQEQGQVNPTTATILNSILGEQQTTDPTEVNSAINTLASGSFGASVQQTMEAIDEANRANLLQQEAASAQPEAGQPFEQPVVQPTPLPEREDEASREQTTNARVDTNTTFATQGVANVPLPLQTSEAPRVVGNAPDLPDLSELPLLEDALETAPTTVVPEALDLPDISDLFSSEAASASASVDSALPELPDLDDLF